MSLTHVWMAETRGWDSERKNINSFLHNEHKNYVFPQFSFHELMGISCFLLTYVYWVILIDKHKPFKEIIYTVKNFKVIFTKSLEMHHRFNDFHQTEHVLITKICWRKVFPKLWKSQKIILWVYTLNFFDFRWTFKVLNINIYRMHVVFKNS